MGRLVRLAALAACGLTAAGLTAQTTVLGGYPEGQAAIREVLLHFDPSAAGSAYPVFRDLLRALAADVQVVVAAENEEQAGAARFWTRDFVIGHRLRYAIGGMELTLWARDRMVAVSTPTGFRLLSPPKSLVEGSRIGDVMAAQALAAATPGVEHASVPLAFEGGNLLFTHDRVLFARSLITENTTEAGTTEKQVLDSVRAIFGRRPVPLGDPLHLPHDHVDMFLTILDARTVLLGDPKQGEVFLMEVARHGLDGALMPDHDRWTVQNQRAARPAYERVERELMREGFRVLRIPILHGDQGVLSYNNALVERRGTERRAYVPVYGLPRLDAVALQVYRDAGCRIFPIGVTRLSALGGTIRCLTNVTRWERPPAPTPTPVR